MMCGSSGASEEIILLRENEICVPFSTLCHGDGDDWHTAAPDTPSQSPGQGNMSHLVILTLKLEII